MKIGGHGNRGERNGGKEVKRGEKDDKVNEMAAQKGAKRRQEAVEVGYISELVTLVVWDLVL